MVSVEILTRNEKETKKLGEVLAREIVKPFFAKATKDKIATILSLEGELGSGKTTFTQGFAKGLGIKESPKSPTFVIMQVYKIKNKNLIHIDAYRIKSKDLKILGWHDFIKNSKSIILIEWGNKIKNILPKDSLRIIFKHVGGREQRLIKFINP